MKLIYKTTIPTLILLLGLVVFVSIYARFAVEEAILFKEMERMVKTSQNALLPEVHTEGIIEEDVHTESTEDIHEEGVEDVHDEEKEENLILNAEDFEHPFDASSQAHFTRYIQEFKDPEIKKIVLWSPDLQVIASTNQKLLRTKKEDNVNLQKILGDSEPFFVKSHSEEGVLETDCIDIFTKLKFRGEIYAIVEVQLNTDTILEPVKKHLNNIMSITIGAGFLTLLAIYFVNNYFISRSMMLARNKEEFFAIASHEMRTPLSVIKSSTSVILDYFPQKKINETEVLDFVKQAHDSSVRLIKIANDFIDTLRLEQGKSLFNVKDIDLIEVIDLVIAEIKGLASEKGLKIVFEKENLPKTIVKADKERTKQVLYNLLSNAIHYTKEGLVTVKVEAEGNFSKVTILDTGMGISTENQELLFKKFQQAGQDVLTREVTLSVGLGLYICKLLVENMHGAIGLAKSEVGKGSEFYFTLPETKSTD